MITQPQINEIIAAAQEASVAIMGSSRHATTKADGTYVTPADRASHDILVIRLRQIFGPGIQILSEEASREEQSALSFDDPEKLTIVIDPLDGTTNFKEGKDSFAVLIGILKGRTPIFGVAAFPAYRAIISGGHTGKEEIPVRQIFYNADLRGRFDRKRFLDFYDAIPERAATFPERYMGQKAIEDHLTQYLKGRQPIRTDDILARLAPHFRGSIHVFDGQGKLSPADWDLAAFDAILRARGGLVTDLDGEPFAYGQKESGYQHKGFMIWPHRRSLRTFRAVKINGYEACITPLPGEGRSLA